MLRVLRSNVMVRAEVAEQPLHFSPRVWRALMLALVVAGVWYSVGQGLRYAGVYRVFIDQQAIFLRIWQSGTHPYQIPGFFNPPWTVLLLAPFSLLPFDLAVFLQACLTFGLLALVILKVGGNLSSIAITLTSFLGLVAILELNIDWVVYLGLLLPPTLGVPLILVKPQIAIGYYLSLSWRGIARSLVAGAVLMLASFVIWGTEWPTHLLASAEETPPNWLLNGAPSAVLPAPFVYAIGTGLAWLGYRRRDPILSIFAGLCFVPYIVLYSLLLHFALLSVRLPRLALLLSACGWLAYILLASQAIQSQIQ